MPTYSNRNTVNKIVGEKKMKKKKMENHGSFPFGKCPKAHLSNKKMQRRV